MRFRKRRPVIRERTAQRFLCPACDDDMTDPVWRAVFRGQPFPVGYDITMTCWHGHVASYYPGR